MAGFDAAVVVSPLEFTFVPYVSCKGVIKEPTDRQIADFLSAYKKMTADVREHLPNVSEDSDVETLMEAMESLDPEIYVSVGQQMAEIVAALCSGFPAKEQILAVPPRVRNIFYGWVQKEVLDPEAETGAGPTASSSRALQVAG